MSARPSAVVIGVGNPLRGDDRAGIEVARRVSAAAGPGVTVLELDGEPSGLIDAWEGVDRAVVIDASAPGSKPGTVRRLDAIADPLPSDLRAASTHALGVAEAVELARALDRLPARLVVYGIEGERFDAGAPLTPAVGAAVEAVARQVLDDARG